MTWQVIEGDCVEQMQAMPECSVDAVVCDPPYGLEFMGKEWDRLGGADGRTTDEGMGATPVGAGRTDSGGVGGHQGVHPGEGTDGDGTGGEVAAGSGRGGFRGVVDADDWNQGESNPYSRARIRSGQGESYGLGNSARRMQRWHEAWAREALRVLKPGGHLLAFGGTRTYHRLACAVEDAGFEIRDTIAWMYGSGFPKSLDVSKAIDNAAGATREVIGEQRDRWTGAGGVLNFATDRPQETVPVTAGPATPDAERWQGWGTALKPAHEPIVVARKPLSGTVAANVLEHGTGALNVDGCRIPTDPDDPVHKAVWTTRASNFREGTTGTGFLDGSTHDGDRRSAAPPEAGRWPANVVLDPDAAAMLDEQTGELHAPVSNGAKAANGMYSPGAHEQRPTFNDPGGASRFFANFKHQEDPWTSDAATHAGSPSSHDATAPGSADAPARREQRHAPEDSVILDGGTASERDLTRFRYTSKSSSAERNAGLDGFEARETHRYGAGIGGSDTSRMNGAPDRNVHPTVKPIELMRWLVRLVTPPGGEPMNEPCKVHGIRRCTICIRPAGLILDPFAGSGTTGCAAVLEGFRFVGLEREPEYAAIARARIAWWAEHPDGMQLVERLEAERARKAIADSGQLGLFGEAA